MSLAPRRDQLQAYEHYSPPSAPYLEWMFKGILAVSLAFFIGLGLWLQTIEILPESIEEKISRIRTRFIIEEKNKPPPPQIKKKPEKKKPQEPVDLSNKPQLAQQQDDIVKPEKKKKKVRRVYGIKKVYSKGIGTRGKLSDAVVGKLGNTLNKDVDTLTATEADIKGEVVSVTTVSSMPKITRSVKPAYTPEMLENKVEGIVKVKILVDVDGKVKKAIVLRDIGYGSGQKAAEACWQMRFTPAMRGDEPVPTWITISIKFVMVG
ncbi:MAG: TonB family protein [Chitinivibrionales bacterium]|nr:TonB family protein [Chitinivibrionales bacterium]